MIPTRTVAAVVLALGLAAGCVTVRASTSPGANLARYQTFAWYTPPTATERQVAFERSPAGQVVRERIAANLAQKGIRESPQHPDFLVAFHSRLVQRLDVNDWGYPNLFWGAAPGPVSIDEYTEGTLFVDFIDPASGQIFWRGTASSVVDHPENPNMQKLAAAVDKVMKKYPSEVASAAPRPTM